MTMPLEKRRQAMVGKARDIVLQSTEWRSFADLTERLGQGPPPSDTTPNRWIARKQIFALDLDGIDHFPSYGLTEVTHGDVRAYEPKPIMTVLMAALGSDSTGWQLATWFASANGYLDGARPMDVLDREPKRVFAAATIEAQGIQHG